MNCREVRRELPDYARGRADAGTAERVSAHLAGCRKCSEEALGLKGLFEQIDPASWTPAETYWLSILPRLHQRLEQHSRPGMPAWASRFALPAAAAVALVVGISKVSFRGEQDFAENVAAVVRQLAPDELEEVADRQAVAEGLQPELTELAPVHSASAAEDEENLRAILREDGTTQADAEAEAITGMEDVAPGEAALPADGTGTKDSIRY